MNGGTTEAVLKFIRRHRMFAASRGAVLAVSGGPDSTALLDILARLLLRANTLRAPDLKLSVAHLNHRLRGSESDQDALFVQQLGDKYGLPVFIGSADVRAESETSGRGIEETAREFRYAFLLEVANRTAADRIVTGHTMDDQAETFLLRLARGAGQRGLAGIRPVIAAHRFKTSLQFGLDLPSPGPGPNREEPHPVATRSGADAIGREPSRGDDSGPGAEPTRKSAAEQLNGDSAQGANPDSELPLLVRPLLCLERQQVEDYCRARGLVFRIDPSNLRPDFMRNRVRHSVIPALKSINPRVVAAISRAAEIVAQEQDSIASIVKAALATAWKAASANGPLDPDRAAYSIGSMLEHPPGLVKKMILAALQDEAEVYPQIAETHVAAVEALLRNGISGQRVVLPGGGLVWRDSGSMVIDRSPAANTYESSWSSARLEVQEAGVTFSIERGLPADALGTLMASARTEKAGRGVDWMMVVLDDDILPARLKVRPRRKGEAAQVPGRSSPKKLKNLMIDHRIPLSRRATWPVVGTEDGKYIWSPRLPPAVYFCAHEGTRALAVLRAEPISPLAPPSQAIHGSSMNKNILVIKSEEEINARLITLAEEIKATVPNTDLTVVGILDDAFVFLADLIRTFSVPVNCCFMKVEQHRHGGQTEVLFTSDFDPRGRSILLVCSVVATGITLDYVTKQLGERGVKSLHTCALIDKPEDRRVNIQPDFTAFKGGKEFVFGYGLGLQNQYRHLRYLATFEE